MPAFRSLVYEAGARLSGLRLTGGALILKIVRSSDAVQLRIADGDGFDPGRGLVLRLGVGLNLPVKLVHGADLWAVLGVRVKKARAAVRGADQDELLCALDGALAGKTHRGIAIDLYGAAKVAAEWHEDGALRSRVRRRIRKSLQLMNGGYAISSRVPAAEQAQYQTDDVARQVAALRGDAPQTPYSMLRVIERVPYVGLKRQADDPRSACRNDFAGTTR